MRQSQSSSQQKSISQKNQQKNSKEEFKSQGEKKYQHGDVEFPLTISAGMEVQSLESFIILMRQQAQERKLSIFPSIYQIKYRPNLEQINYIYFVCRECKATINLKRKPNGNLIVNKVNQIHQTSRVNQKPKKTITEKSIEVVKSEKSKSISSSILFKSKQQSPVITPTKVKRKKRIEESKESLKLKEILQKIPNLTEEISKEPQQDQNSFIMIESILKDQNCEYLMYESKEDVNNPDFFIVVSQSMKESFHQFSDFLYFNIFVCTKVKFQQPPHNYMLGLFVVFDWNNRPLIVAEAFFSEYNSKTFQSLFEMFFSIHKIKPNCIMINDFPQMQETMESLQKSKAYEGVYILNPLSLIFKVTRLLKGKSQQQIKDIQNFAKKVINAKYDYDVLNIINTFDLSDKKLQDEIFKTLQINVEKVLRYCYPKVFVSFGQNLTQQIDRLPSTFKPTSTASLLTTILSSERSLKIISTLSIEMFSPEISAIFCDERLQSIRTNFEKKVCERFFENYVEALKDYEIVTWEEPNGILGHKGSNKIINIQNWKCGCGETERSGIPCAHLLCCAKEVPTSQFIEMVTKRWIRKDLKYNRKSRLQQSAEKITTSLSIPCDKQRKNH